MWAMMWAMAMAGLTVDNGGVDGGRWKGGGLMMLFCLVSGNIFDRYCQQGSHATT